MQFSWIGTAIAAAVLLPNLVLAVLPPRIGTLPQPRVNVVFTALERAGQLGCLVLLVFVAGTYSQPLWGILVALCIATYWSLWLRYVVTRNVRELFAPLGRLPIPMAVFPVLAFALSAVWAESPWIGLAAAVLAVGHLTVSWRSWQALNA